jgi:predicted acylesterase/phospholipase RssA
VGAGAVGVATGGVLGWPVDLRTWQVVAGLAAVGLLLLARGAILAHLLTRRFFTIPAGPTRLEDIRSSVRHVFCATDLNSAQAATFEAGADGGPVVSTGMGIASAPRFRLAAAVRASAAFPGLLPPARLRLRPLGLTWRYRVHRQAPALRAMAGASNPRPGRVLHLADGGVSNNLATDELSRRSRSADPHVVVVVDASAPMATSRLRQLALPFLGEIGSLQRAMTVLYANTVEPRIAEMEARGALILARSISAGAADDVPVIADAGDFPLVVRVTDNTSDGVSRVRRMRAHAGLPDLNVEGGDRLDDLDAASARLHATRRHWNEVADHLRKRHGLKVMAVRSSSVPTTFGRVPRVEALGLVLHGYLGTMLACANTGIGGHGAVRVERFERLLDLRPDGSPGFTPEEPDLL